MEQFAEYEDQQRGSKSFPFGVYRLAEGSSRYVMPYHWHMDCELVLVEEGSLPISVDNLRFDLRAGEALLIPPGAVHGSAQPSGVYRCIVFDLPMLFAPSSPNMEAIRHCFDASGSAPIFIPADSPAATFVQGIFRTAKRPSREVALPAVCGNLLCLFAAANEEIGKGHLPTAVFSHAQTDKVKAVILFIRRNYQKKLTLQDLAEHVGLNKDYLCRLFKSVIGKPPVRYLIEHRIKCSEKILLSPTGTVTDAALASGFDDIGYYIRQFSEVHGVTPLQFRRGQLSEQKNDT